MVHASYQLSMVSEVRNVQRIAICGRLILTPGVKVSYSSSFESQHYCFTVQNVVINLYLYLPTVTGAKQPEVIKDRYER
jgi:hypothetical protein